jgi:ribosomal protein S27E
MTRLQKIKLLDKIDKKSAEFDALRHYVFYCNKCNFKITVTDRPDTYIACQVGNYYEYEVDRKEYGKYIKENERNINGTMWSRPADSICLNCGNIMILKDIKNKIICEKCNNRNIVSWHDLPKSKCPSCNGKFDNGIIFNTYDELREWNLDEWIELLSKAKEKYGIIEEKTFIEYSEEENSIFEKENILLQYFMNERYVLNNKYNIIKFDCHRSFDSPFCIIVEWFNNDNDGNIIFCMYSCEENERRYIAKRLEIYKLNILLSILNKYKYFSKPNKINRHGFDGSTWTLEVQIGNLYKEIDVWSPNKGVIYDIGKLLIEYSGVIINELY